MTTGESLLTIVIICGLIFGTYLITKKQKWRLVLKLFGVIILLSVVVASSIYAYNYYKNLPTEANSLAGLVLGMKEVDVTLKKGKPDTENTNDEGIKLIKYQDYTGNDEIMISISPTEGVTRVCSFKYSDEVFSLGKYDSYETIIKKLGEPPEKSINKAGTAMFVTYPQYNLAFGVSENEVELTCITAKDKISFYEEYSN